METLLIFILTIATSFTQSPDISATCRGAQDCGVCISLNPMCAWCTTDTFSSQRCDTNAALMADGCANITNPQVVIDIVSDRDLSVKDADLDVDDIVQVKPQRIKLKVRPNEPTRVRLEVRQAEDYPVDLYYAMDLSFSMENDLTNLNQLGSTLVAELGKITQDYQLGFGAFVDKTVEPFSNTVPGKLARECARCDPPYGFHNIHPLDRDSTAFYDQLQQTSISKSQDAPEGGADALMQLAVCGDIIGWRTKARHLIVFTTDAASHFAGDGRLGGCVEPNDGLCHIDPVTGMYTMSNRQDYPSIGHLAAKLRENNVIPIFAVTNSKGALYRSIKRFIQGSTVGVLAADSRNVVELIKSNYELITSQVTLLSTAPDAVRLDYTANCLTGTVQDSNECSGLKLGDTVSFDIDITAEQCIGSTNFTIGPVGFNEELVIELEVACDCECQNQPEANSSSCTNGNGTLLCGECECNPDRYGSNCECSGNDIGQESSDQTPCIVEGTGAVCSGRGECVCGKCICANTGNAGEKISGRFCECDNFNCPYSKGLRCGGPERGQCVCDVATGQPKCQCLPGYIGVACDCPTTIKTCTATNGLPCNAYGRCVCGVCECFADSDFQGRTCETCPSCPTGECHVQRDCAQCLTYGTGRLTEEQCELCAINIVNVTDVANYSMAGEMCTFTEENGTCTFTYVLVYDENNTLTVYAESEQRCVMKQRVPPLTPQEIIWVVLGIIAGIVLIGLLAALLYQLYLHVMYKREYSQFEKQCKKANWDMASNPSYKSPVSEVKNPMYMK